LVPALLLCVCAFPFRRTIYDWPSARIDELSASFGNFDRVVGLGWLLNDALGRAL